MGYRFRRSLNLGKHFRINFSKSGIGYSYGFKGYRVTKTAKGTTRRTVTFPSGISYVEETKAKKKGGGRGTNANTPEQKAKSAFVWKFVFGILFLASGLMKLGTDNEWARKGSAVGIALIIWAFFSLRKWKKMSEPVVEESEDHQQE